MIRILLLCASISIAWAQSTPNLPHFVETTPDYLSVAFHSDGQTAWAVAANGLIYRSTDAGMNWTGVDVPGEGELAAIRFHSDGKRGWTVGSSRAAYTVDGGLTWIASSGVPQLRRCDLTDVIFDAQGKRGFAVGWPDMILASEDGGISWVRIAADTVKDGYNSIAFDRTFQHGLVGGLDSLLRSSDGGRSWTKVAGDFRDVRAVWMHPDGSESRVMSTASVNADDKKESYWVHVSWSGELWTTAVDGYVRLASTVAFRGRDAIALGDGGIFLRREGSGGLQRVVEGSFKGLAFSGDTNTALAVGTLGRVDRTDDGGTTWRTVHEWTKIESVDRIAVDPATGAVWAAGGKLFRSDTSGGSFREVKIPDVPAKTGGVLAIKFSQRGFGWMTTKLGYILRTKDSGVTWEFSHQPYHDREIRSVAFDAEAKHGVAVGDSIVWVTEDSGANWAPRDPPVAAALLNDVWLTKDGNTAWLVTGAPENRKGRVFRSDDHCRSWKEIANPSGASLYRIAFSSDGRLGWIAGSDSTVLRTEDRGRTWLAGRTYLHGESSFHQNPIYFQDIWFNASGGSGWAVGAITGRSALFRSVDSGQTWDQTTASASAGRIAFSPDGRRAWAVAGDSILVTAHDTHAPRVTQFDVNIRKTQLNISADDPDTPADRLVGTVEIEGGGLELEPGKYRRTFALPASDTVVWPEGTFRDGVPYTFHLRLTDGWNITTQDFHVGGDPPSGVRPAGPTLPLDGVRAADLTGSRVLIDGKPVESSEIIARGGDGTVSLSPSPSLMKNLPDGFHALSLTRGSDGLAKRIGFYKQQLSLKLFKPYGTSYALIIAINDYPADSGYRKLPSAVQQARQLEKTLRAQGFTVLPLLLDRDATKARIEAAIRTAPAIAEDRLLVYFGGHGDDEKGFQGKPVGYLVPYDGRKSDLWGTAIPLEKVSGEYSSRLAAKHVLFALDSCQSGLAITRGGALDLSAEELRRFKALAEIESLSSEPGRSILTAGTGGQDALDVSGGIFTSALTDAISGKADADRNGVVDYYELFAYVWGRVNAEARHWIRKQQPADAHLGNGRWVFVYQ